MTQKRQPEEERTKKEGSNGSSCSAAANEKRQKVPALKEVIMEALKMNRVQMLLSALEPLVRRVVKEEVEKALANHLTNLTRQCGKQIHTSTSRSLRLQFTKKLSLPIFTGTRIEAEDSSAISIALIDGLTGQIVDSGLESSMKIEIVVLEGDFEGSEEDNWSFEDFKNNIVREREGKRSLLTGELLLDLNEGFGVVGEISFTDNSSWTRSRKFRLGARVVDGLSQGVRVREAKTEPFMVKDHRGELYKKHYPPSLWDEVWRLEKIGKDGAFHKRLISENINTVKDFLTLFSADAVKLRTILGSGMSTKMWEMTVEHARTCMIPDQMYVYFANNSPQMKPAVGVVFNIVGIVLGLLSQDRFVSINNLSESEKAEAHGLVKLALEHWNDVMAYNDTMNSSSNTGTLPGPFPSASNTQSFENDIYINSLDPTPINKVSAATAEAGFTFGPMPDDNIFSGCSRGPAASENNAYAIQNLDSCRSRVELETISNSLMFDECVGSQSLFFSGEDNLQQYLPDMSLGVVGSPADLGTAVTGFLAMSARSAAARDKANTVWGTLVSVLRWRFSIKKIVAMKRRVHQQYT